MKKYIVFLMFIFFMVTNVQAQKQNAKKETGKPKVTFIELGSVNCIPCRQMQPVMKAVETNYGETVKVIFYDVWTKSGKPYAEEYRIKLIPTQVFLDEKGKEFFRHEGFYPKKEIDKLLQGMGINPINKKG